MLRRKIILLCSIGILLAISAMTFADGSSAAQGCYIDTAATLGGTLIKQINEGEKFLATVYCTSIPDQVFGFEFGTTFASQDVSLTNYASISGTTYTPGTFVTDVGSNYSEGSNSIASVYAVSRQGSNTATGDFTLGSFWVNAPFGLIGGDSSAEIDIPSATFKLSDNSGAPITGDLQAVPGITVTITDLQIALLDGTITVQSDGTMTNLKTVDLVLNTPSVGTSPSTVATQSGSSLDFPVSGLQYTTFAVDVAVNMDGHLSCNVTDTLSDGANAAATAIGTITLYAGDVEHTGHEIDNLDAIAIGSAFGQSSSGEVDINGDGEVDIFDLVHVGRNFGVISAVCPSTGLNA